uniref:Stabilin 1 n=1 Tax=Ornithorhynchus anatinus TaxID=9258 RepID=F7EKW5_ORNAN
MAVEADLDTRRPLSPYSCFLFQRGQVQSKRCDLKTKFMVNTQCTSCAASKTQPCPTGWMKDTRGRGEQGCSYTVNLGETTISLSGCNHLCRKEFTEKSCCPGFWGSECYECPGGAQNPCSGHGTCLEGITQNGTCLCEEGFTGFTCQECQDENMFGSDCKSVCDCQHGLCSNGVAGDGSCLCFAGYTGPRCDQELPICKALNCPEHSQCVSQDQKIPSCKCLPGYQMRGDICQALDPCSSSPCSPFALCKATGGQRYTCTCKAGYQGDGKICQGLDPCTVNYGGCPSNSTICVYRSPGKSTCVCKSGTYSPSGNALAGCLPSSSSSTCRSYYCDRSATCQVNSDGKVSCVCKEGEIGNGRSCYGHVLKEVEKLNSQGRFYRKLQAAHSMLEKGCRDVLTKSGPITVLVPTSYWYLKSNSNETIPWQLCRLHIIPGLHLLEEMSSGQSQTLWTLAGEPLTLTLSGFTYKYEDQPNQLFTITQADLPASNGYIHIVNSIRSTPYLGVQGDPQKTIAEILASMEVFSRFETILENCGLPTILDGPGPFTVFSPSNKGVDSLRDGRLIYLFTKVRVFPPSLQVTTDKLITMPRFLTTANQIVAVNVSDDGRILLGDSRVPLRSTDILASNGIIHILDGVLLPPSILPILPHRCNREQLKIVSGSCVDCQALNSSVCPPNSVQLDDLPKECVYVHDPLGLNLLKKGCARYCNQTISNPDCCKGFFGPDCTPCPGGFTTPCYGRGNCSDGIQGNGNCLCFKDFKGIACHICSNPNRHGERCQEECGCKHGICDNRPGSGGVCQTGTCKPGFTGVFCNETILHCGPSGLTQYCHSNALCVTVLNQARCSCLPGFEGDGFSCNPVNLCTKPERGGCSENADCIPVEGKHPLCRCHRGWTGDGKVCVAIDNCVLQSRGGCHADADCSYVGPGQNECMCKRGFAGDGFECSAIDPCRAGNGGCHGLATCKSLGQGQRECKCPRGYAGDGLSCYRDILGELERNSHFGAFYEWIKVLSFSILPEARVTALVPSEAAVRSLSREEEVMWLQPHILPFLVRYRRIPGAEGGRNRRTKPQNVSLEVADLPATNGIMHILTKVVPPSSPATADANTVKYHVILGETLTPSDLRSGVHKNSMLGPAYWLMFYNINNQTEVNHVPVSGPFLEIRNGVVIGVSSVLTVHKNRCRLKGWHSPHLILPRTLLLFKTDLSHLAPPPSPLCSVFSPFSLPIPVLQVPECCEGYYGLMCEPCPGRPGAWCSGNGQCQGGIWGKGECRCREGFHGTACEVCELGRYGPDCARVCNCGSHGQCQDGLHGDGRCICKVGWIGPRCDQGEGALRPHSSLLSSLSSFLLPWMTEIDPCASYHGGCSPHANCTKVAPGERICSCTEGYSGDGELCLEIDGCLNHNGGCHAQAECVRTGPNQVSPIGRALGPGTLPTPTPALPQNNGGCSLSAVCNSTGVGERTCTCSRNTVGDGITCRTRRVGRGRHQGHSHELLFHQEFQELVGEGPYTVFVPHEMSEARVIQVHRKLLFRYHVVGCRQLLSSDLQELQHVTTLSGHTLSITEREGTLFINEFAKIITSDQVGVNGVFHFIDEVLLPPEVVNWNNETDIMQAAESFGYTIFSKMLKAGLLSLVNIAAHQPYTMLWPTDAAFNALPPEQQVWLNHTEHRDKLAYLLKAHMIRDIKALASDLPLLGQLRTMYGSTISFSCSKTRVGDILTADGDARLVQRHMEFSGGIAYGIDRLLEPPGLGARCDHYVIQDLPVSGGRGGGSSWFDCKVLYGGRVEWRVKWLGFTTVCPGGLEAPCNHQGSCQDGMSGTGSCLCNPGFTGVACELCVPGRFGAQCKGCNCSAHGRCDDGVSGSGFCFCSEGWSGVHCETRLEEIPTCSPPCDLHAVCRPGNICECDLFYEGDGWNCSVVDRCRGGHCSPHATCSQTGLDVNCTCLPDYQGDGKVCSPRDRCADGRNGDCSEHADCIGTGPNTRRCQCRAGYVGNGVQCLEEATPPNDRCLDTPGPCHSEAICSDLHFQEKTAGVFHLQSSAGKYNLTYSEAASRCAAQGAQLASLSQLSAAQQLGFHLCLVGWLVNGSAGYATSYPSPNCGNNHVGIVNYGVRANLLERWDAYCYRLQDVECRCRDGFVGDGNFCNGKLLDVLADNANYSIFYSMLLDYANMSREGLDFFDFLSDELTYKTLFVPLNSGFGDNMTLSWKDLELHASNITFLSLNLTHGTILPSHSEGHSLFIGDGSTGNSSGARVVNISSVVEWDIVTFNGIIHSIESPMTLPLEPVSEALGPVAVGVTAGMMVALVLILAGGAAYFHFKIKKQGFQFHYFKAEEEADDDFSPWQEGSNPPLITIPNPIFGGHNTFYEPFDVSGASLLLLKYPVRRVLGT